MKSRSSAGRKRFSTIIRHRRDSFRKEGRTEPPHFELEPRVDGQIMSGGIGTLYNEDDYDGGVVRFIAEAEAVARRQLKAITTGSMMPRLDPPKSERVRMLAEIAKRLDREARNRAPSQVESAEGDSKNGDRQESAS
jgi:hypothetical protein